MKFNTSTIILVALSVICISILVQESRCTPIQYLNDLEETSSIGDDNERLNDKRAPGWGKRAPGWGKRAPGWGKRAPGWGKRQFENHESSLKDFLSSLDLEEKLELVKELARKD